MIVFVRTFDNKLVSLNRYAYVDICRCGHESYTIRAVPMEGKPHNLAEWREKDAEDNANKVYEELIEELKKGSTLFDMLTFL